MPPGFPPKKKVKMLKRVRKAFKVAPSEGEEGEEGNKSPGKNTYIINPCYIEGLVVVKCKLTLTDIKLK